MDNAQTTAIAHGSEPSFDKKAIWRTFRVLLVITIVELILAIGYYEMEFQNRHLVKHILNGVFIILTLTKAFYIIAEFMHLGHEIKNLILTLAMPALLFIWFIIAFLWDGNSFKNLRNNYDRYQLEQSKKKVDQKEKEPEAKKPGSAE
jgi:cytochrome c oxidase subunit IV